MWVVCTYLCVCVCCVCVCMCVCCVCVSCVGGHGSEDLLLSNAPELGHQESLLQALHPACSVNRDESYDNKTRKESGPDPGRMFQESIGHGVHW